MRPQEETQHEQSREIPVFHLPFERYDRPLCCAWLVLSCCWISARVAVLLRRLQIEQARDVPEMCFCGLLIFPPKQYRPSTFHGLVVGQAHWKSTRNSHRGRQLRIHRRHLHCHQFHMNLLGRRYRTENHGWFQEVRGLEEIRST